MLSVADVSGAFDRIQVVQNIGGRCTSDNVIAVRRQNNFSGAVQGDAGRTDDKFRCIAGGIQIDRAGVAVGAEQRGRAAVGQLERTAA